MAERFNEMNNSMSFGVLLIRSPPMHLISVCHIALFLHSAFHHFHNAGQRNQKIKFETIVCEMWINRLITGGWFYSQANKPGFSGASSDVIMFVMSKTSPKEGEAKVGMQHGSMEASGILAFLESLSKHRNST